MTVALGRARRPKLPRRKASQQTSTTRNGLGIARASWLTSNQRVCPRLVLIVSADKDFGQCVGGPVVQLAPPPTANPAMGWRRLDPAAVTEKFGALAPIYGTLVTSAIAANNSGIQYRSKHITADNVPDPKIEHPRDAIVRITAPWTTEPWLSEPIDLRLALAPVPKGWSEWTIEPVRLLADARMDPPVAWGVLSYIAPVLADATRTSGRFSLELDGARLPVGDPAGGALSGTLAMLERVYIQV